MRLRHLLPGAFLTWALAAPLHGGPSGARTEGDAAFRHVLELSGVIGPRKTGSDAERRAIEYIASAMETAGLKVARQEVPGEPYGEGERSIGTWNVMGELAGDAPDTIVLAAHHDSESSVVPGANDDASGVAVLLEVARAVARRPHRLTYRFVSFGAEEEGLLGSRFYAERGDLSPVRVMIALELVGRGELLVGPVPGPPALWAQDLLLRAAEESGTRGVVARPLWTIAPRFIDLPFGADHEPFLERGIPALLVLGTFPAWTYHTTEDAVGSVRPESLGRAVKVIDRMLRDLDTAALVERREDPHYLPLMLFGRGVLIPSLTLTLLSCAALFGWGFLALLRLRAVARPRAIAVTFRVLIVTGAATALGLSGPFLSERLMEWIHGVRYPWMAHQGLHVASALAWGLVSSWMGLKLFRRIKPTVDPGPYLAAAFLVPVAWVALALRQGLPEIAALMAVPILMFLVSGAFSSTGRKIALGLGAAAPFFCLFTLRDYRALVDLGGVSPPGWALFGAAFSVVFPLALYLAHVASFQDCLHSRVWRWLSGPGVGLAVLGVALVLLAAGVLLPAYDHRNRQVVRVRERIDLDGGRASAILRSSDVLRGVAVEGAGVHGLDPSVTTIRFDLPVPRDGLEFIAEATPEGASGTVVTTRLTVPAVTERLSYVFTSRAGFRVPGRDGEPRHRYTFTEIIPRHNPVGTFRLIVPEGGDLAVELRAEFVADLLKIRASSRLPRVFVYRTTLEGSRRLLGAAAGARPADAAPGGP